MAKPTNRQELVEYALRRLGAPVLEINVADEQLDDILDDTIQYFQERHYDGVIRTYLKYQFTADDLNRGQSDLCVGISSVAVDCKSDGGSEFNTYTEDSNYIKLPPHIIGVEKVFTPTQATGGGGSGTYPLGPGSAVPYFGGINGIGGIGNLGGNDMISYYMGQMWRETYDFLFNPAAMIRFNKRMDRLYLDINWNRLSGGQFIIIDCYRALDPDHFTEIYNDSWVKKYLVAAIKKQWGQNLIKFTGTKLPGGVEMNGRQLYDDGVRELEEIKNDMSSTYELPPLDFVG